MPGVSLSQARASLQVTTAALAREFPDTNKDSSLVVIPETHARPNPNIGPFFRVAGTAFAALAVLLLLITSANVTNLLMARAASREREVSLRAALGAGRGRLVRQLLTESVVLALLASAVAMPIAILALRSFERGMAEKHANRDAASGLQPRRTCVGYRAAADARRRNRVRAGAGTHGSAR